MLQNATLDSSWNVDGPDPVPWPGENYEMVRDLPGFVEPQALLQSLNQTEELNAAKWSLKQLDRSSVESIYVLEQKDGPWSIRARLAGDGSHPDVDRVSFALEFEYLLGSAEYGSYNSPTAVYASSEKILDVLGIAEARRLRAWPTTTKDRLNRPIISSRTEAENFINELRTK